MAPARTDKSVTGARKIEEKRNMYFIVYRNLNTNYVDFVINDDDNVALWDTEEEAEEYALDNLFFLCGQAVYEIYEAP